MSEGQRADIYTFPPHIDAERRPQGTGRAPHVERCLYCSHIAIRKVSWPGHPSKRFRDTCVVVTIAGLFNAASHNSARPASSAPSTSLGVEPKSTNTSSLPLPVETAPKSSADSHKGRSNRHRKGADRRTKGRSSRHRKGAESQRPNRQGKRLHKRSRQVHDDFSASRGDLDKKAEEAMEYLIPDGS